MRICSYDRQLLELRRAQAEYDELELDPKRNIILFWVSITALILMLSVGWVRGAETPPFALSDPVCQTGTWIAQRYDEWRRIRGRLTIVKHTWIRRCYLRSPKS